MNFKSLVSFLVVSTVTLCAGVALAGDIRGPQMAHDIAPARTNVDYVVAFRGGERAAVYVKGDGSTDLDCFLINPNGVTVASDTDGTDTCLLEVIPVFTTGYTVRITNLGFVGNEFWMRTN